MKFLGYNEQVLALLNYSGSGITHLEAFISHKNEIIFLEIAARAGGAWLPKLYNKYLQIDFFTSHFLLQINDSYRPTFSEKGPYCACFWFPSNDGVVRSINQPELKSAYKMESFITEKQKLQRSKTLWDRIGEITVWNNNFAELYADFNYLKNFQLARYE